MKQFIGTCVENPFASVGDLCQVVETAKPIMRETFIKQCDTTPELRTEFRAWLYDYEFYHYQGIIGNIYFYTWSAIEHFYKG